MQYPAFSEITGNDVGGKLKLEISIRFNFKLLITEMSIVITDGLIRRTNFKGRVFFLGRIITTAQPAMPNNQPTSPTKQITTPTSPIANQSILEQRNLIV